MYFSKPSKAIDVTAEMLEQIERVTGSAVAAEDIVVFEAAVANTRPLNKMGSIFHSGRISEDTLRQMAEALNSGAESVPDLGRQGLSMALATYADLKASLANWLSQVSSQPSLATA